MDITHLITPYKLGRPVLTGSGEARRYDRLAVDCPTVFFHNGRYYMMHVGFDGTGYQTGLAVSDDLVNWTKVDNPQPLFTRGARGTWDQGAIWAPSTFEYNGTLYMYYEGWGRTGTVPDRDKSYFTPAHSSIGLATCKTDDFLKWCGLK